jgi:hypothetical protein
MYGVDWTQPGNAIPFFEYTGYFLFALLAAWLIAHTLSLLSGTPARDQQETTTQTINTKHNVPN